MWVNYMVSLSMILLLTTVSYSYLPLYSSFLSLCLCIYLPTSQLLNGCNHIGA